MFNLIQENKLSGDLCQHDFFFFSEHHYPKTFYTNEANERKEKKNIFDKYINKIISTQLLFKSSGCGSVDLGIDVLSGGFGSRFTDNNRLFL